MSDDREPFMARLQAARDALARIERGESPTAEELAAAPLLNFWCVVVDPPFPVLQGVVIGHPRLADGAMIGTSPLLWLAEDRSAARTVSRFYRLGVPLAEAMPRQCQFPILLQGAKEKRRQMEEFEKDLRRAIAAEERGTWREALRSDDAPWFDDRTWGFEVGDGWAGILRALCVEIAGTVGGADFAPRMRFGQVKEKLGTLCI